VNPIAPAASVLLVSGSSPLEVYVVRRSESLRFFAGFYAFPGGKVHRSDAEIPVVARPPATCRLEVEPARCVAAARELFEETGVLLAHGSDVSFPPPAVRDSLRRELIAGNLSFAKLLAGCGLSVWESDWRPLGRLVTPPFTPFRFDTTFFFARLPPEQQPEVWPGELAEGRWATPPDLLERWEHGEYHVSPPTLRILEALRHQPLDKAPQHLAALFRSVRDGDVHPIWFAPGVQMIPLRTLALPPSTHTNAFLVGQGPVYLIDPGPTDGQEQATLFHVVEDQQAAGRRLTAVVLTHHHPDHIGAAAACAECFGVPVWAHPWTAQKLQGKVKVTGEIRDGDRLSLGTAPDGFASWHLDALHTPGHAPGHLVFHEPHYQLLFAGDMVSTLSSVVIVPPEGDLAVYLDSLRRLRGYAGRLLLPAHGNPTIHSLRTIDESLAHRAQREAMLLAALEQGPRTVPDLAGEFYKGLPEGLARFAQLQVTANLNKLLAEGRVEPIPQGAEVRWRLSGLT
jgi:glyoxylase-like metal-dependent hydrolase (beta-lactamase superfamily II)/8-oxo-dGTP pyrophosphatase MutT (NUDIX family)